MEPPGAGKSRARAPAAQPLESIGCDFGPPMRRAVAITFALAGCAGAPPREPRAVPSLARFADAFAFVPPDMLSFSFDEARVLGKGASMFVASTADVDEVTKCLRVRAGRDFEVPD